MYLRLLFFLAFVSALAASAADRAKPFWKAKEKVYDRVRSGEIILAVRSENKDQKNQLKVSGGGRVQASPDFVFREMQNYEELSKLSDFVRESKFDPVSGILTFRVSAFGYHANMKTRFKAIQDPERPRLEFLVVQGPVAGFQGAFLIEKIETQKTEIELEAHYSYVQFPMPEIFLKFGLEVIYQRLAHRLRAHLETKFKNGQ